MLKINNFNSKDSKNNISNINISFDLNWGNIIGDENDILSANDLSTGPFHISNTIKNEYSNNIFENDTISSLEIAGVDILKSKN